MKKQNIVNFIQYICCILLRKFTHINPRIVIFTSMPDYSDNSLALSEYLIKNGYTKNHEIYWCVKDAKKYKELYPNEKIHFFQTSGWGRLKNLKIYLSAQWLFGTHSYVCYDNIPLREGQHLIRLWHGCSYKDKDALNKNKKQSKPTFEKALVAGPLFVKTKSYFWDCPENMIIAKGYPRYDWLKQRTLPALQLYSKIKGNNNKVIIWMPTYRVDKSNSRNDTNNITQFPLITNNDDWLKLDSFCIRHKISLLIKLHPMQKEYPINWVNFNNIKQITNDDLARENTTLYSFLAVTDGLISDYSSVGVDYMIVNKPIAFTLDDYHLYKEGRGFVVEDPRKYMPGHHLYNLDDLISFIHSVSKEEDIFKEEREKIFSELVYKSDCYCKEILETIGFK